MNILKRTLHNQSGAGLLMVVISVSVIIFIFMVSAGVKLMEASRLSAQMNERLRYSAVIEDLSQAMARAYVLGKGTCPGGTTATVVDGESFCFPNSGVTGAAGVTGICVDLDQNAATTIDTYCVRGANLVSQNDIHDEMKKMYAERDTFKYKLKRVLLNIFDISSAYACTWWGTSGCNPTGAAAGATTYTPTVLSAPPSYTAAPGGAATQPFTADSPVATRNNAETWSPVLSAWAPANQNEILTPNCSTENQYHLGCIRCQNAANAAGSRNSNIRCIRFSVCRMADSACTSSSNMYRQFIAVLVRDQNI